MAAHGWMVRGHRLTLELLIETLWRDLITSGGTSIAVTKAAGTLDRWVEWVEYRARPGTPTVRAAIQCSSATSSSAKEAA